MIFPYGPIFIPEMSQIANMSIPWEDTSIIESCMFYIGLSNKLFLVQKAHLIQFLFKPTFETSVVTNTNVNHSHDCHPIKSITMVWHDIPIIFLPVEYLHKVTWSWYVLQKFQPYVIYAWGREYYRYDENFISTWVCWLITC